MAPECDERSDRLRPPRRIDLSRTGPQWSVSAVSDRPTIRSHRDTGDAISVDHRDAVRRKITRCPAGRFEDRAACVLTWRHDERSAVDRPERTARVDGADH
ncbi:hypothetical protein W824_14995 [Clavibacter cf. michiganensis LMG 26808]|nr:hypothetical protein W824_14995 [Clavibacter cf. michiganensis LMG 26808]